MTPVHLDRYIYAILRYRWPVVALAVLIMLVTGVGALFITVTNNYRIMFGEDNPQLAAFKALENTFSTSNMAIIAIAPRKGSVFTREALRAIEELTEAAWRTPHSRRVDSLTNYTHSRAQGDELIVEPLVDDARSLSNADIARIRKIALESADLAGRLVSRDERVGGLVVTFVLPDNMDAAVLKINDYLNALLKQARARHPDIAYYMSGDVIINRAFAEATFDDFVTLGPIVFLMIIVTTTLLLRSLLGTVSIIVVIGFVVTTTMGIAGWLGTVFSPANAGVPTIVMATCVAHSVHIITTTLLGMGHGLDKDKAIAESLRSNAWPVFLTSLTTAAGFLSLNYSDSPPFRILGNLVALGVACAFIYSMTLLPALLSFLPLRARRIPSDKSLFFDRFGAFVVRRRAFLLSFVVILTLVLISGIPRNELTERWAHNFDERYQYRRDTDFISQNLTGLNFLEYALKAGRESGITDPGYLRKVEAFAEWCRKQTEVTHVQAFSDIMKRLNKNMHGDDPAFYEIPEDPKLAAQYLLLYEFSLPFGMRPQQPHRRLQIRDAHDRRGPQHILPGPPRSRRTRTGLAPRQHTRICGRGVRHHHDLRASFPEKYPRHAARHDYRHGSHFVHFDTGFQKRAPGPHQPRAQLHSRGHELRPVGSSGRPGRYRLLGRRRHRLRNHRGRHDSLSEQISENPP